MSMLGPDLAAVAPPPQVQRAVALPRQQARASGAPAIAQEGLREWRRLSDALMHLIEQERQDLSTHLHGEVEPRVIAVKLLVEDALHRLGEGAPQESVRLLDGVLPLLRGIVEDLRESASALRPQLFDELGLRATLEWQSDAFAEAHPAIGVVRRLTARDEDVPAALRLHILRIAQDALGAVARRSGVRWVRIGLYRDGPNLNFLVEDNGVDPVVPRVQAPKECRVDLGMAITRWRAETTGGRLTLKKVPRLGTQLRIVWRITE